MLQKEENRMNRKIFAVLLAVILTVSLTGLSNIQVFAAGSVSLSGTYFQPYEYVTVTVSSIQSDLRPWVGLIPADVSSDYDSYDVGYAWISDLTNNQWTFRLPSAEGDYKVGVFLDDDNDRAVAMSGPIYSYHNDIQVYVNKSSFEPAEEVVINISSLPVDGSSGWLGLVPAEVTDDYDSYDTTYIWTNNLINNQWTFNAPLDEGSYKVGVFLDNAYDQVVGMSQTFTVRRDQVGISLSTAQCQPGDTVTVTFSEYPIESTCWLGLIPADVIGDYDSYDVQYIWLDDTNNTYQWTLTMPWVEGDYKVGMFVDNQEDLLLGMSSTITSQYHTITITPDKTGYLAGETMNISISESPVRSGAWLGLIPAGVNSDYDESDIAYTWTADLDTLTWTLIAPETSGSYKVGAFLDYDGDQVVGMSSSFMLGQSGTSVTTPAPTTGTGSLPALTFTDFNDSHWAYPYVQHMVSLGIITGYPDNTFRPDDPFSRAAFAKLLALSFDLPSYSGSEVIYSDIPATHWAYGYVMSANNYLTAYEKSDGSKVFLPNNDALREDVAVAMVKAMGLDPDNADLSYLNAYSDAGEVSTNLRNYVALAIEYGVMKGSGGYFYPQKVLTRAEASTLFSRFLTDIKDVYDDDDLIKVTN